MAVGGPRSSCVRPGAHSAQRQDSRKDLTPCRMALHFVSAGAHALHSDETFGPTATRGASHSARRLRSLAFLGSSDVVDVVLLLLDFGQGLRIGQIEGLSEMGNGPRQYLYPVGRGVGD